MKKTRQNTSRDAYLWPHINQEDLSKPRILPLLLNARGHHGPSVFALADIGSAHFGIVSQAVVPMFRNQHITYFRESDFPLRNGRLVSWEETDETFDDLMVGRGLHPGEALLALV